jgi:tetratricopeptide (TPR) repeat protein
VGAKARANISPDRAGSKSSLLQEFRFASGAANIDDAAKAEVESGFAVTGEESAMQSGQWVFGYALCAVMLLGLGCSSKPSAKETQSVSPSKQQDKASPASGQPQTQANDAPPDDSSISYAKNPERFRKMETVAPPFTLTNPKTATDFFDVGVHEDNLHHYDKAIAAYESALKLKPDWTLLRLREAKDYKRLGQPDTAIAQLKRATKIDPHYWDAYSELALTYKDMGDTKHAIEAAAKLLDFPPMQIPVHNQLGYWYEETGDKPNARQQFEMYRDLALKTKTEAQTERYQAAMRELQKVQ